MGGGESGDRAGAREVGAFGVVALARSVGAFPPPPPRAVALELHIFGKKRTALTVSIREKISWGP